MTIPYDWTPTAANINALPKPLREYIMRLSTDENRAGLIAKVQILEGRLAAVNRMLEERQWQPIETAPRDGPVDVWNGKWRTADAFWAIPTYDADDYPVGCWCCEEWHGTYEHLYNAPIEPQPTHWMPLPEPPDVGS